MFIMHTHVLGKVISDPVIVKDESAGDLYCTYSILVKEEGQLIPFTVYVSDKEQINVCRDRLVRDSVVFINGSISIHFHGIQVPRVGTYSFITSNMTVICNEFCIVHDQKKKNTIAKTEKPSITSLSQHSQKNDEIPDELPF